MVAIGRQPNINKLGLQNTGKYTDKGNDKQNFKPQDIFMRSVIVSIHSTSTCGYEKGELAVQHLLGETVEPLNYTNVPRGVYTNPEIASVGYTRETLPADKEVVIGTLNFNV